MGHKPSGVYYDLTKEGRKLVERLLTDVIGTDWVNPVKGPHVLLNALKIYC